MAERNHAGRLELTWTDKDKALLSVGDGRYDYTFVDPADWRVSEVRLFREVGRYAAAQSPARSDESFEPTSENLLITGDAMHVLDALSKIPEYSERYLGKVKLVYIDPPFNTGQTFAHYEDNIEHSIWLTMLRDRLRQIKPLLAEDGSVWVHLDHAESHRCRAVLDEEFGYENFVAEIAWQKSTSPKNDSKRLSVSQDVILVYRASSAWRPNRLARLEQSNTSRYRSRDGDPTPWRDHDPTASGGQERGLVCAVQHPFTGGLMYPARGNHWRWSQERMLASLNQYAPYELRDIGDEDARAEVSGIPVSEVRAGVKAIMLAVPLEEAQKSARKRYEAGMWPELLFLSLDRERLSRKSPLVDDGRVPETMWTAAEVGTNLRAKNEIEALFPDMHPFATPKPEQLLQRIIQIATDPGEIVLDCFAGSGTTAAVAHKMGRRWVTSELLPETVEKWTLPRLRKVLDGEVGGISTVTRRVAEEGIVLPVGVRADDAFKFQQLLKKVMATGEDPVDNEPDERDDLDEDTGTPEPPAPLALNLDKELATIARRLAKTGDGPLDTDETKALLALLRKLNGSAVLDVSAKVKAALNKRTKTREVTTRHWFGGGGFTHLEVGPSMFVEYGGMLLLADWATQSELSRVICAQLSVPYRPDGIFAGRKGRTRYVVIDGMVGASTVEAILDRCEESEVVEVWATQIEEDAVQTLRKLRPGSSLHAIPAAVLDSYRRRPAAATPFRQPTAPAHGGED